MQICSQRVHQPRTSAKCHGIRDRNRGKLNKVDNKEDICPIQFPNRRIVINVEGVKKIEGNGRIKNSFSTVKNVHENA